MKVILLRDVAKIGKRFAIVDVPDGYALNKLIPSKDAEPASANNIKRINQLKERNQANKAGQVTEIKEIVEKITSLPLQIIMEANDLGHLFQAVKVADVVKSAKERDITIPEDYLKITETIKTIGDHQIIIETHEVSLTLPITVVAKSK